MGTILSPLASSFLGFDQLFGDMERLLSSNETSSGYPPLNLYRDKDDYVIELALAGFKKSDVVIEHDKKRSVLTVTGIINRQDRDTPQLESNIDKSNEPSKFELAHRDDSRNVIRKGIATRRFTKSFNLADDLEVESAKLEDGLLTIKLKHVLREEDKPLLIKLS